MVKFIPHETDSIPVVKFLRSRAEQLADYLRGCISRGELVEPMPGTRTWSQRLGVSRSTLDQALRLLRHEGLIDVRANRGITLIGPSATEGAHRTLVRSVRIIYYGRDFPEMQKDLPWMLELAERLHANGVQLALEKCTEARLKAYARAGVNPAELLILISLPARFQALFAQSPHEVLLMGEPAAGVDRPFVTSDWEGALRHGARWLLRQGYDRLTLILPRARAPGLQQARAVFEQECADWTRQTVRANVVELPLELTAMVQAAGRFARTVRDRRGILVTDNIPPGLVMTALAAHGVRIPRQAELVALVTSIEPLKVFPLPTHYRFSERLLTQTLTAAVLHYFETGTVPALAKRLPMEMTRGDADPA